MLTDATRARLGEDGAELPEVQAWAARILERVTVALGESSDLSGVINCLWTQAMFDQLYGPGLDSPALNLLGREVAAWAIEREAERVIEAVEVEL